MAPSRSTHQRHFSLLLLLAVLTIGRNSVVNAAAAGSFDTTSATPPAQRAQQLIADGWWRDARQLLEVAVCDEPADPALRYLLGYTLYKLDEYKKAEKQLDEAVALDPDNASYHRWLGSAVGKLARHGSKFKAIGRAKKCRRSFERAIELNPRDLDTAFVLLQFYLRAPRLAGGDKAAACELAEHIARQDPVRGHGARSLVYEWDDKDYESARRELLAAVSRRPADVSLGLELAAFHQRRDNVAAAEAVYRDILARDETAFEARYRLADCYRSTERYDDTINELELILRQDPGELPALYYIADALVLADRDLTRARKLLCQYVSHEVRGYWPSHAQAHWRLATIHDRQGRRSAAVRSLELSLEQDPKFSSARRMLAVLLDDDF